MKHHKIHLDIKHLKDSLIILDGYDEAYLSLEERRITIQNFFEKLVDLSKKLNSKIIVTSRKTCINDSELKNLHNGIYETDSNYKSNEMLEENKIQICQLSPLTKEQQKEWIKKYNKLFPNNKYNIDDIYNLHRESNKQSKISELLEIPLLLQLIVSEHFYDDAKNIVELYDKLFVKILDTRKEITKNNKEHFKSTFESFAYSIYKNNDQYAFIKSKELKKENKNEKLKAILLFYMKNIKENQQNKYYIEFVHRSFYQYFQAWYFYNLILDIETAVHKINLEGTNTLDYISIILEHKDKITDLFTTGIKMKDKVAKLFEAICWRRIERDVIDRIGEISQNQKQIQNQEQINYILDIFEKTDGIIKKGENGKWYMPIGEPDNLIDKIENIMYNLLMILNIIMPNGLTIIKNKRIEQLMKKFDITNIYLPRIVLLNLDLTMINLENANLENANLENAYLEIADLRGANLEKANLNNAQLKGANLAMANLAMSNLEGANLEGANLEGANLKLVHLEKAHLEGACFNPAILKNAILKDTKISRNRYEEIAALGIDVSNIIWCDE